MPRKPKNKSPKSWTSRNGRTGSVKIYGPKKEGERGQFLEFTLFDKKVVRTTRVSYGGYKNRYRKTSVWSNPFSLFKPKRPKKGARK